MRRRGSAYPQTMPSLPSGTVTFLFSDIEGSTTLLKELGDAL
jgi:class 3 adenylate cyclase